MTITEAITARHSTRTYDGHGLTPELADAVREAAAKTRARLTSTAPAPYIDFKSGITGKPPSTYGNISGASDYLILSISDYSPASYLNAGAAFESLILDLTAIGLSTCWMTGTFSRGDFGAMLPDNGNRIVAVSPVGLAAGRENLRGRIMKAFVRSTSRKPVASFTTVEGNPLRNAAELDAELAATLELIRSAPSARNRQPWHVDIDSDGRSFTISVERPEASLMLDLGIACAHAEATGKYTATPAGESAVRFAHLPDRS